MGTGGKWRGIKKKRETCVCLSVSVCVLPKIGPPHGWHGKKTWFVSLEFLCTSHLHCKKYLLYETFYSYRKYDICCFNAAVIYTVFYQYIWGTANYFSISLANGTENNSFFFYVEHKRLVYLLISWSTKNECAAILIINPASQMWGF